MSKQSDEMLSRLASANKGLQEQISQLVNGNVLKHKRITADLHKRIREVEFVLKQRNRQWQSAEESGSRDFHSVGQPSDEHYPT
eukprot:9004057-Karenia_brevis.AAC.1